MRSLISLDTEEREWLQKKSAETGQSMSYIVRIAVRRLKESEEASFDNLLRETSGVWKQGDGLAYQTGIRNEWD